METIRLLENSKDTRTPSLYGRELGRSLLLEIPIHRCPCRCPCWGSSKDTQQGLLAKEPRLGGWCLGRLQPAKAQPIDKRNGCGRGALRRFEERRVNFHALTSVYFEPKCNEATDLIIAGGMHPPREEATAAIRENETQLLPLTSAYLEPRCREMIDLMAASGASREAAPATSLRNGRRAQLRGIEISNRPLQN